MASMNMKSFFRPSYATSRRALGSSWRGAESLFKQRNYAAIHAARGLCMRSLELPRFEYDVEKLYDKNYLNVPSLPLPELESTLERYLETVRPLASDEEFRNTQALVSDFRDGFGPKLHEMLSKSWQGDGYPYSYIEPMWDDMYLGGRWPVMINSSPYYIFPEEKKFTSPVHGAAMLASACIRWWLNVVEGSIEADMAFGKPLCMHGVSLVFGAARKPMENRDGFSTPNRKSRHVIVACNHKYFRLEVVSEDCKAISSDQLHVRLLEIQKLAYQHRGSIEDDVGLLSCMERDYFARERSHLVESNYVNAASVKDIDDSLFVISLDDPIEGQKADELTLSSPTQLPFLTGKNGGNRWWDKHNIVVANGRLGMMFDHTFGDGLIWNRMLGEAWCEVTGRPSGFSPLPVPSNSFDGSVKPLEWKLSKRSKQALQKSVADAKERIEDVDLLLLDFVGYGRNRIKEMKLSPDALVQMAFQLAYFDNHKSLAAVYESCAMRNYFHGRTETIRSCTNESVAMIRAFSSDASDDEKRTALHQSCATHVKVAKGAKAAVSGGYQGVDRHLLGLKTMGEKSGSVHPIFTDPLFTRSSTWNLSTSNVTAPFVKEFGFGAVTSNGYGLGYMTLADSIPVSISSYKSSTLTSSSKLANSIQMNLERFDKLFQ